MTLHLNLNSDIATGSGQAASVETGHIDASPARDARYEQRKASRALLDTGRRSSFAFGPMLERPIFGQTILTVTDRLGD
jgi:hypothetical protein